MAQPGSFQGRGVARMSVSDDNMGAASACADHRGALLHKEEESPPQEQVGWFSSFMNRVVGRGQYEFAKTRPPRRRELRKARHREPVRSRPPRTTASWTAASGSDASSRAHDMPDCTRLLFRWLEDSGAAREALWCSESRLPRFRAVFVLSNQSINVHR